MKTTTRLLELLTALLIVASSFSVFAVNTDTFQESENTSTIQSDIGLSLGASVGFTEPLGLQREPLLFSAELIDDNSKPGIYGTLNYIPEDTKSIYLHYSFGGIYFDSFDNFTWDLDGSSEGKAPLTQLCIKSDEHPLTAYQRQAVNSLYVKLYITREGGDIETEVIKFSHKNSYPLPETPPSFTANIELDSQGYYQLNGNFKQIPPNVARVRPMYSLDGQSSKVINETYPNDWYLNDFGTGDAEKQYLVENQICAMAYDEPLKSYLANKLDLFYLRLQITTENGDIYNTHDVVFERGMAQPLPLDKTVYASFPFTMRVPEEHGKPMGYPYGQYQITAREDASTEDLEAFLPDTLPIEVQILQKDTKKLLSWGRVNCQIKWKKLPPLSLTSGEAQIIPDAAEELILPAGSEVITPLGIYLLPKSLHFKNRDEIRLVINAIGKDEKPDISLRENSVLNTMDDYGTLSLAFRQKPSGASAIRVYSFVNDNEERTEICDLLDQRDINYNQSAQLYGYMNILQPDLSPLSDYLSGTTPGFSIALEIEGGVFDGEHVILPWPGDYNPPEEIFEPDSSQGNPGNVGSEDDEDENSNNGGQRPNLPQGEADKGDSINDSVNFTISTESPKLSVGKSDKIDSIDSPISIEPPKLPEETMQTINPTPPIVTVEATSPTKDTAANDALSDLPNLSLKGEQQGTADRPSVSEAEVKSTLAPTQVTPSTEPSSNTLTMKTVILVVALLAGGGVVAAMVYTVSGKKTDTLVSKLVGIFKKLLIRR